jgi:hypothetical protein
VTDSRRRSLTDLGARAATTIGSDPGRRHLAVAAVYVVMTAAVFWPLVADLSSSVLGTYSDATSTIRDYAAAERQDATPFTLDRDELVNAPEGLDVSPSVQVANAIQPLFVWGLHDAIGFVAAWNLFVLLGIVLSAFSAYFLLHRLGAHPLAALFGGAVFGFNGYLVEKAFVGHGGLVHAWVLVVVALALLRLDRAATIRNAVLVGAAVALAFYMHNYYGLIAGFLVVIGALIRIAIGPARLWQFTLVTAGLLMIPALVAVLRDPGVDVTTFRGVGALQQFGARIPAYVTPNVRNPVLGSLVPTRLQTHLEASGEPSLFFGFTTIGLAVAWLTVLRRRAVEEMRRIGDIAVVVGCAAFVMSLPRLLDVGPFSLPMPSWFIGHVTTAFRVYARFGIVVGLCLIVLAAFALHVLIRSYGRWVAAVAFALVAAELVPGLPPQTLALDRPSALSQWLERQPRGIVAHYPDPAVGLEAALLNGREIYAQTHHWQPLHSTGSPRLPRLSLYIRYLTRHPDQEPAQALLATQGVRYVVVHHDVYREMGEYSPGMGVGFEELAHVGQTTVYRVTAAPAGDIPALIERSREELASIQQLPRLLPVPARGFYGSEEWKEQEGWRWVRQDALLRVRVPFSTVTYTLQGRAFSGLNKARVLTVFDDEGRLLGSQRIESAETTIRIGPFRLAEGPRRLRLHLDPGPQPLSPQDNRFGSIFLSPVQLVPLADPLGPG